MLKDQISLKSINKLADCFDQLDLFLGHTCDILLLHWHSQTFYNSQKGTEGILLKYINAMETKAK